MVLKTFFTVLQITSKNIIFALVISANLFIEITIFAFLCLPFQFTFLKNLLKRWFLRTLLNTLLLDIIQKAIFNDSFFLGFHLSKISSMNYQIFIWLARIFNKFIILFYNYCIIKIILIYLKTIIYQKLNNHQEVMMISQISKYYKSKFKTWVNPNVHQSACCSKTLANTNTLKTNHNWSHKIIPTP
jgi:hypothetical protein